MRNHRVCSASAAGLLVAAAMLVPTAAKAEYQWWNDMIGATWITQNQANFGSGVRVGVIDGLANYYHAEFEGRLDKTWIFSGGTYTRFDNHGTHVAGIIGAGYNGFGMVGIAPQVWITNVAIFDDRGWAGGSNGTRLALDRIYLDGGTIANMSYGPIVPGLLAYDAELAAISAYHDKIVVALAAGNDGQKLKSIKWDTSKNPLDNLIIVGSVDANKNLSWFSNTPGTGCFKTGARCKKEDQYMYRFLVAPGENILSTSASGGYMYMSGTSMAAPMVAGAAALLQSHWEFLKYDPKATADILLTTAEDLGKKGVDPVYGRGLLRVDLAMQPVGETQVATGSTVESTSTTTRTRRTRFRASRAFGNGSRFASALDGMVVFDAFKRDFPVDAKSLVDGSSSSVLPETGGNGTLVSVPMMDGTLTFTSVVPDRVRLSELPTEARFGPDSGYFGFRQDVVPPWHLAIDQGAWSFSFGQRVGLEHDLVPHATSGLFLFDPGRASLPMTSLGEQALHSFARYRMSETFGVAMGFAEMRADAESFGWSANPFGSTAGVGRAYLMQAEFNPTPSVGLQLTQTYLTESEMLLGGSATGAFALGGNTFAPGVAVSFKLPASINARLHYTHGTTQPADERTSLFREVGTLYSRSFGFSLTKVGVFGADDEIGFTVNKPLQVYAGKALLETPIGRTVDGEVIYRSQRVSLAPAGSQTDFELAYRAMLTPSVSAGVNLFYQHELDHEPGKWNAGGLTRLRVVF